MGLPAARFGDLAGHGGTILIGAPTVLINGMMAARVGDPLVCPGFDGPKPHVLGNIVKGSVTVKIGGAFAARLSDMTGCGVAGIVGTSMPPVAGPPPPPPGIPGAFTPKEGALVGTPNAGAGFTKTGGFSNADGEAREGQASVARVAGEKKIGGSTVSGSIDAGTVKGEANAGKGNAFTPGGAGASASASGVAAQGKITNENGSSVGGSVGVANASAGGTALVGSDGRRTGVLFAGGAQASLVQGQADSVAVYNIPFTNQNLQVGTTVGGSAGSIGGEGAIGAFHDKADNRHHAVGLIDLELLLGIKFGMDISFGSKPSPPLPPAVSTPGIGIPLTPGTVLMGSPTVLIG